jgi:hypothetical protein
MDLAALGFPSIGAKARGAEVADCQSSMWLEDPGPGSFCIIISAEISERVCGFYVCH